MGSIWADGVKGPGALIGQQIDALQAIMELRPYKADLILYDWVDELEKHFQRVESVADLLAFADGAENHIVSVFGSDVTNILKRLMGDKWPGQWHVRKEIEHLWPVFDDNFARDLAGGDPMSGVLNSMRVGLGKKVNYLLVEKPDFLFNAS
jgi:hypothetical protein